MLLSGVPQNTAADVAEGIICTFPASLCGLAESYEPHIVLVVSAQFWKSECSSKARDSPKLTRG
jgi:hypothetical protein